MDSRTNQKLTGGIVALLLIAILLASFCQAQPPRSLSHEWAKKSFTPPPRVIRGGELTVAEWRALIDQTWGPARETPAEQCRIFDKFWAAVDAGFACFPGLELDWNAVRARYRPELEKGVSRGRMTAIMDQAALALMDGGHSNVDYEPIHFYTEATQGVPMLLVGWRDHARFGAGLTPLPDGRLLVYSAHPDNALGLKPGDIVLGYDGKPWSELYRQLIAAELPLVGRWAAAPSAYEHTWLASGGLNWHLFETIDVLKYDTKEVVHLPTAPLNRQRRKELFASEQLPIPGVPYRKLSEIYDGETVSWGQVKGTKIGYIYIWRWMGGTGEVLFDAVRNLTDADGLIIDLRANLGGDMFQSDKALSVLFPRGETETIVFLRRNDVDDHFSFAVSTEADRYIIHGAGKGYLKPIAVLVGPGAVSSGDQVALRLRFHPRARLFGKPTNGAFSAAGKVEFGSSDWSGRFSQANCAPVSDPRRLLTRGELPVDVPVWLTPDDVAKGRDTVVEAAIEWIRKTADQLAR